MENYYNLRQDKYDKLVRLTVYEQWLANFNLILLFEDAPTILDLNELEWPEFIDKSLYNWTYIKEGYDFWLKVAKAD